jgi:hypothetical protein
MMVAKVSLKVAIHMDWDPKLSHTYPKEVSMIYG